MKDFRNYISEDIKNDKKQYKKDFKNALASIEAIIIYGRKSDVDNTKLNPLLEAIKNLHLVDDALNAPDTTDKEVKKW